MTPTLRHERLVDSVGIGIAASLFAWFDVGVLWVAGKWPLHYTAPSWAYVALWLLAADIQTAWWGRR